MVSAKVLAGRSIYEAAIAAARVGAAVLLVEENRVLGGLNTVDQH
jgi:pyruvate/2-oxoglutarate dehydrogenase complex dihydrolipoamide dehydrogenase (E3) component